MTAKLQKRTKKRHFQCLGSSQQSAVALLFLLCHIFVAVVEFLEEYYKVCRELYTVPPLCHLTECASVDVVFWYTYKETLSPISILILCDVSEVCSGLMYEKIQLITWLLSDTGRTSRLHPERTGRGNNVTPSPHFYS